MALYFLGLYVHVYLLNRSNFYQLKIVKIDHNFSMLLLQHVAPSSITFLSENVS